MTIKVEKNDRQCRVAVDGDMTIFSAQALQEALLAPLADHQEIEVDLSGVSEIDSAGLQLLVMLKLEASLRHKTLRFTGHSPAVQEIVDLCDLGAFFGDPVVIHSQA